MELELNRTHLTGYDTVLDTTVFQEETLETIVPDACPDILRLVDTQGKILLKSKTALDGQVTLTGTARLTVLYLPDGGTGPCRLEVNIPFNITAEEKRIRTGCLVTAVPRVSGADTRTMNPRKVVTRVEIAVGVKVFTAGAASLCTGVSAVDGTVEQLMEAHQPTCIAAVQEKQISFEDDLNIPAGRPAAEELINSRVELSCHESKIIGSKLIFKGEAVVQLLYRPTSGGLDAADFTLPFSQIAEVAGVGEDGICKVEMSLTGAEFVLGGDGRTVSASLSMLAQAIVREERSVELLADTYSTCCPVRAERVPYDYQVCQTEGTGRQMVREAIETGLQIKSVVDAYCTLGQTTQNREGSQLRLTAQVGVTAVCMTEEADYCAISRGFEVNCAVDVPEDCICLFSCQSGDLIATPMADGVEVRFPLDFPYLCLRDTHATVVRDVSVENEADSDPGRRPSVVLRVLDEGERLWDVAKRYSTTIGDIVKANELESEQPCGGTLLLIPRKR